MSNALCVALLSFTSVEHVSISAARSTKSSTTNAVNLGCLTFICEKCACYLTRFVMYIIFKPMQTQESISRSTYF